MRKNNKELIIIVSCLLLVIGVSFSYFVAKTLLNGNGSETKMTTAIINGATVKVEGTLEFNDTDIMPGHKIVSGIKVTATGNNELIPYNLIWNGSNNLNTQLNFTVYKTSSELAINATCEKKTKVEGGIQYLSEECTISNEDKLGSIIGNGTISGNTTDTKVILAKDEFITATSDGSTVYYYVILEYPNLDENQNPDIGSGFNGEVTVEASNTTPDINILAVYIKQEDGTYQETQDIPQEGYVINSEKSTCTNGTIPEWDNQNKKLLLGNLTKSGTSCYLYFENKNVCTNDYIACNSILKNVSDILESPSWFSNIMDTGTMMYSVLDDSGTSFYYRGSSVDTNNWVQFANYYWRIIRINGDGSIRMIYNGPSTAVVSSQLQVSSFSVNRSGNDNAYVGFMYGAVPSTTYEEAHKNINSSAVKIILDNWYRTNIYDKNFDQYISKDAGFCGDREINHSGSIWWVNDTKLGYGRNETAYHGWGILRSSDGSESLDIQKPSLICTNKERDLYTVSSASYGNKALTYPIGLITVDEAIFAGGLRGIDNRGFYLYTGKAYWTMTPEFFNGANAYVKGVSSNGNLILDGYVWREYGIRPVINLSSDVKLSGTGTTSDPYKIVE